MSQRQNSPNSNRKFLAAVSALGLFSLGVSIGWLGRDSWELPAWAQQVTATGAALPTGTVPNRDVYYPGTEALKPDEMRVVACGTGMPSARPKQAAACFLVELGNGDKFIFDIGTGSAERLSALKIPYDYLDKVFVGHLHSDHIGDMDALWIGGVLSNRQKPLRVWGPSGPEPELGTKYAMERLQEAYTWDQKSRLGNVNTVGLKMDVKEFDYKGVNQVIYQENGVTIRSIPAVHALDGSVSFILEWNGLKFAFSSDTYPNKWWMEHAKNADIAIHECFLPPNLLVTKQKFPVADALNVGTQVHTDPAMFGRVMSLTKPKLAVAYHFANDFDTQPEVSKKIRSTYDGPLAIATDYMVFNVDKKGHQVRMSAIDEDIWPPPATTAKLPANPKDRYGFSEFIKSGREVFSDLIERIYKETNKEFGTNYPTPK
ncbi:MAG: guanitoxin biosynthesis MBL fold metallo-hydrolase GntH [Synechocystis sp.]|nr:guanitoxin biosynthesis MBL fold metallo-hydrolase GntH [Synechocystis sp.]